MARATYERPNHFPLVEKFTFEIELTFPEEVEADSNVLMETIADAIRDYDFRNRLLPGKRLPRSGERLIGTAICLQKRATEPDRIPKVDDKDMPLGFHKSGRQSKEVIEFSGEIDDRVEKLRQAQEDLWTAFNEASFARTEEAYSRAERKLKRVFEKAKTIVTSERSRLPRVATEDPG